MNLNQFIEIIKDEVQTKMGESFNVTIVFVKRKMAHSL